MNLPGWSRIPDMDDISLQSTEEKGSIEEAMFLRMEDALRFIVQRGWMGKTENVFTDLAQHLGEVLCVDYVIIAKFADTPGVAEMVAFYANGSIAPNTEYRLDGTPCGNVMDKNFCYYQQGIQELFPHHTVLADWGVTSYAGISLRDSTGKPIGLLAVLGRKPFSSRASVTLPLNLVAAHASAELERMRSDRKLHILEQELSIRRGDDLEEERKLIAQDLHDELGQQLTALRLDVSLMRMMFGQNNPLLVKSIQKIIGQVDDTIQVVRNVASRLRPAALDIGIVSALEWQAKEFAKKSGLDCELNIYEEKVQLDEERATAIFRIVQESLTNITRHAKAKKVDISLRRDGARYVLEVCDDGIGFNPETKSKKTFGLRGMQERVLKLKGELSILSAPGAGTAIKVCMPV